MKILAILINIFFIRLYSVAQVASPVTANAELQLESNTAGNEGQETEDDAYLQVLMQLSREPVEMNEADEPDLNQFRMLTPVQIQNFLAYRKLTGKLLDVYELQAIPGWDIDLIRKMRPYIKVSTVTPASAVLKARLRKGEHQLLFRLSQVPERAGGYVKDTSANADFYQGSPQKILMRYQYKYKHLLQYGILAEKDAGEQFFRGEQKAGFDFYSAHLFIRKLGIVKTLALGDFTVNLGQGLIQWQSLAFKKNADVLNVKREAEIIRPYNSADEINFHRGLAVTVGRKNWQFSAFGSYRKMDANFVADTLQHGENYISSLQTTGYHRTSSELADKGILGQLSLGGNFSYWLQRLRLGINTVQYNFKLPIKKTAEPYNQYAFSGKSLRNYSFDFSYTYKNVHFFGEAALASTGGRAFVGGLLVSTSPKVDVSILYRNLSKNYQSFYANAFTESGYPANETGLYAGVSVKPLYGWRIDAYADFYKFPWLKYRIDASSTGFDYLIQLQYMPNRQLDVYTRYHYESKAINFNPLPAATSTVVQQPRQNWRTQISYQLNSSVTVRCRNEIMWFDKNGLSAENGFLFYFDLIYKPMLRPYSGNIRLQFFDTEGYNSRVYAYENDVLYNFAIPSFYDKGYKYYINLSYRYKKNSTIWIKWAQTVYSDKKLIGSGFDEIKGNTKSDIKLQFSYIF